MRTDSLTAREREIIADLQAVCRRCGWPVDLRPGLRAYLDNGGAFSQNEIIVLGGWKRLCALAGMRPTVRPRIPVLPVPPDALPLHPADAVTPSMPSSHPNADADADPGATGPDPELLRRLDAGMAFIHPCR